MSERTITKSETVRSYAALETWLSGWEDLGWVIVKYDTEPRAAGVRVTAEMTRPSLQAIETSSAAQTRQPMNPDSDVSDRRSLIRWAVNGMEEPDEHTIVREDTECGVANLAVANRDAMYQLITGSYPPAAGRPGKPDLRAAAVAGHRQELSCEHGVILNGSADAGVIHAGVRYSQYRSWDDWHVPGSAIAAVYKAYINEGEDAAYRALGDQWLKYTNLTCLKDAQDPDAGWYFFDMTRLSWRPDITAARSTHRTIGKSADEKE